MVNPVDKGLLVKVGMDDSNFATGFKGLNQQLKIAQNEFKNVNAIVGKNSNSIKDLGARYQAASKVFQAQKAKVEALGNELENTRKAVENNSKATQKDKDALLRQTQAYNNAVGTLAKYERQMNEIGNKIGSTDGKFSKFNATLTSVSNKLNTVGNGFQEFGNKINGIGGKISDAGSKMTAFVSVPVAGAMAKATTSAVQFGDEMTKMQAVSGASKRDMDALRNASLNAAKTYGIGTKEYNAAATELMKAGYSGKESMNIMSAGIKTAKATGEDLETVLDKTSNTMKIYGYDAKDASKVTDKLAYVANASKTSVSELGDGLTKVGPVAHSLGINLDTTSAALGVLQDRGFKVEEAATGMKAGLANLVNPSKQNAVAFEKLGINLNDVKKNGVNLPKILNDMRVATQGMTQSQREAYIAQAFGKESMAQWTALMQGDAIKALNTYSNGAKNATGSVDSLWKKMKQSPKAQIDQLKGSFEALAINIGEKVLPVVLPVLENITKKVNSLVNWFSKLDSGTQETIVKMGMLAVAGGPVVFAFGKLVSTIGSLVTGFGKGIKSIGTFVNKTKDFIVGVKSGTNWIGKFKNSIKDIGNTKGITALKNGFNSLKTKAGELTTKIKDVSKSIGSWIGGKVSNGFKAMKSGFSSAKTKASELITKIKDVSKSVGSWIGGKVSNGFKAMKSGFSSAKTKASELGTKIKDVTSKVSSWSSDKVKGAMTSFKNSLDSIKTKAVETGRKIGDISSKINSWAGDKVKAGINALKNGLSNIKTKANEAAIKVANITKSAIESTKAKGNGKFFSGLLKSITDVASKSKIGQLAIRGLSAAFTLMSGPVGIAVAAIGAIGTAFVLAYKHCKPFRDFINGLASWFKRIFNKAVHEVKQFGLKFVNFINDAWNKAKKVTSDFIGKMKKYISDMIGKISNTVKNWKIVKWFSDKWSSAKKTTSDFIGKMKKYISDMVGKISNTVKNWKIVKWFGDKWNSVKSKADTFKKDMIKKIGDLLNTMVSKIKNSKIGKAFGDAFNSAKKLVKKPVEGIAKGANWVIDKLGGPKETIPVPLKWATGTPTGGHPGGLAMVNDGHGPNYQEAVTLPSGQTFIPRGKNVIMNLPRGTQVTDGRTTAMALKNGMLRRYKDGTDESWLSKAWSWGKKAVSKVGDVIGDVMDYMDDPMKLVKKVVENFVDFSGLVKYPLDLGKGVIRKGVDALKNKVQEMFAEMTAGGNGDGAHGDLGSNKWFQIHGNWVREWQYRLLEDIIKQYNFRVTDGGRRTWDNYDHSKGRAMDIAIAGNPLGTYWKVAKQIDKMPFVKYVNSNMKSTITGHWAPSNLEPRADHIHVSFTKEILSAKELKATSGNAGGSMGNPGGAGVQRWRPYVIKALKANGLPTTPAYVNAWLRQIQSESGGDPKAVQHGYVDVNTGGNEARGLLQTIPPTFNAHKFPGHGNIYNGYDNMLAAIHYAKERYGAKGMLQVIGHGHGYEKGGLVSTHQIAQLSEGNKPEMILPLTNKSRSVQLINKAKKLIGEDVFENDTSELEEQNNVLRKIENGINTMNKLLEILVAKDTSIYIDDTAVARATAKANKLEQERLSNNYRRLRGVT